MLEKIKSIGKEKTKEELEYFNQEEYTGQDKVLEELENMQEKLDYENYKSVKSLPSRASRHKKLKKEKKQRFSLKRIKKKEEDLYEEPLYEETIYEGLQVDRQDEDSKEITQEDIKQEKKAKISIIDRLKNRPKKPKRKRRVKIVKKDRISVDIGSKFIKIVEGMYDGKAVSIKNLATTPTPKDSYLDGDITDIESLETAISTLIHRSGMTSKEVIYTTESKSVISREVEFPSVDDKDIKQMMDYQVEEYFPVNLDEYVMQSKLVEEIDTEERKESKLSVSILPKVMCEDYLALTRSLSLKPIALDLNDNSIYKLLSECFIVTDNEKYLDNKTLAILDIGHNVTNITIIDDGVFRFSRLIEVGGRDISRNIEQSLDIPGDEVERIKVNIGSVLGNNKDTETDEASNQLRSIRGVIQESLSELCLEAERIFRYHTGRSSSSQINEIYIYGASSRMIDIDKFIENTLNIPTYKIDTLENVKLAKQHRGAEIMQYANAIGAIMRM